MVTTGIFGMFRLRAATALRGSALNMTEGERIAGIDDTARLRREPKNQQQVLKINCFAPSHEA